MVARLFNIGKLFGYTDKEIWHSTPKKLQILFDDYLEFNGRKSKEENREAEHTVAF